MSEQTRPSSATPWLCDFVSGDQESGGGVQRDPKDMGLPLLSPGRAGHPLCDKAPAAQGRAREPWGQGQPQRGSAPSVSVHGEPLTPQFGHQTPPRLGPGATPRLPVVSLGPKHWGTSGEPPAWPP